MRNTLEITTLHLILRRFTEHDTEVFFKIMNDRNVNTFQPCFSMGTKEQAKKYLQVKDLNSYLKFSGYQYAVCLRSDNIPIGYLHISDDDSHDFGFGLASEFWHKGIISETYQAVIDQLNHTDILYLTVIHDINNPRSGNAMNKIGMIIVIPMKSCNNLKLY